MSICDALRAQVVVVGERHDLRAGPANLSRLIEFGRSCNAHVDCVFLEVDHIPDECAAGNVKECRKMEVPHRQRRLLVPWVVKAVRDRGVRLVAVDDPQAYLVDWDPAALDQPARTYLLDGRSRYMADRVLEEECERGILLVGNDHTVGERGIPSLLEDAGLTTSVLKSQCGRFWFGLERAPSGRITGRSSVYCGKK